MDVVRLRSYARRLLSAQLETTSAGAELALVRAFAGLRAVNLTQLWLAVSGLLDASPRPVLNIALVIGWTLWSAGAVGVALHQRRITDPRLVWSDVAVAVAILAAMPLVTTTATRVDTWHNWAHPVSLSTALIAGAAFTGSRMVGTAALLASAYLATTLPGVIGADDQWTVVTNAVAYIAFVTVGWALAGFLRRLGADADAQRARAEDLGARVGAEAELDRHRALLHDHATLLHFIGHAETLSAEAEQSLRAQARDGASRVRAFLSLGAAPAPPGSTLAGVVAHAAAAYPELPLTVNVDTAAETELDAQDAEVLGAAVGTLLANVRAHAAAQAVTVHAGPASTGWEVVVRDDGAGFDPATTARGFGLSRLVVDPCRRRGIAVTVESAPGEGTTITLTSTR